jgi:hypothetical protein
LLVTGTASDTGPIFAEHFAHYEMLASLRSSGTSVLAVQTSVAHCTENGHMQSPLPPAPFTVITLRDGGNELLVRISPIVPSNWSGYVRLVGAPVFT